MTITVVTASKVDPCIIWQGESITFSQNTLCTAIGNKVNDVWLPRKCLTGHTHIHTKTDAGQSYLYVPLCFAGYTKIHKVDKANLRWPHCGPCWPWPSQWEAALCDPYTRLHLELTLQLDHQPGKGKWNLCQKWRQIKTDDVGHLLEKKATLDFVLTSHFTIGIYKYTSLKLLKKKWTTQKFSIFLTINKLSAI